MLVAHASQPGEGTVTRPLAISAFAPLAVCEAPRISCTTGSEAAQSAHETVSERYQRRPDRADCPEGCGDLDGRLGASDPSPSVASRFSCRHRRPPSGRAWPISPPADPIPEGRGTWPTFRARRPAAGDILQPAAEAPRIQGSDASCRDRLGASGPAHPERCTRACPLRSGFTAVPPEHSRLARPSEAALRPPHDHHVGRSPTVILADDLLLCLGSSYVPLCLFGSSSSPRRSGRCSHTGLAPVTPTALLPPSGCLRVGDSP